MNEEFPHYEDYEVKPENETCPICGRSFSYEWDGEEWILETAWWFLPGQYDFLCGKICWRKAAKENYYASQGNTGNVRSMQDRSA